MLLWGKFKNTMLFPNLRTSLRLLVTLNFQRDVQIVMLVQFCFDCFQESNEQFNNCQPAMNTYLSIS